MIKEGKKRITITLDEDTLKKCDQWAWMRPSWSYWVNIALLYLMNQFDQSGAERLGLKTKKYKIVLEEIKDDQQQK